jgi:hypothetical protein
MFAACTLLLVLHLANRAVFGPFKAGKDAGKERPAWKKLPPAWRRILIAVDFAFLVVALTYAIRCVFTTPK